MRSSLLVAVGAVCVVVLVLASVVATKHSTTRELFTAFVAPEPQLRHTLTYRWLPSLRTYYDPLHNIATDPLVLTLKQASPRFEWLMYRPGITTQPGVWVTDALSAFAAGAPPLLTLLHPQDPMVLMVVQPSSLPIPESVFNIRRLAYAHPQAAQLFKAMRFATGGGNTPTLTLMQEYEDMIKAGDPMLVYAPRHDPIWKRLFFELNYRSVAYKPPMDILHKTLPFVKQDIVSFQEKDASNPNSMRATEATMALIVDRVVCLTPESPAGMLKEDTFSDLMATIVKAVGVSTFQDTAYMTKFGFETPITSLI